MAASFNLPTTHVHQPQNITQYSAATMLLQTMEDTVIQKVLNGIKFEQDKKKDIMEITIFKLLNKVYCNNGLLMDIWRRKEEEMKENEIALDQQNEQQNINKQILEILRKIENQNTTQQKKMVYLENKVLENLRNFEKFQTEKMEVFNDRINKTLKCFGKNHQKKLNELKNEVSNAQDLILLKLDANIGTLQKIGKSALKKTINAEKKNKLNWINIDKKLENMQQMIDSAAMSNAVAMQSVRFKMDALSAIISGTASTCGDKKGYNGGIIKSVTISGTTSMCGDKKGLNGGINKTEPISGTSSMCGDKKGLNGGINKTVPISGTLLSGGKKEGNGKKTDLVPTTGTLLNVGKKDGNEGSIKPVPTTGKKDGNGEDIKFVSSTGTLLGVGKKDGNVGTIKPVPMSGTLLSVDKKDGNGGTITYINDTNGINKYITSSVDGSQYNAAATSSTNDNLCDKTGRDRDKNGNSASTISISHGAFSKRFKYKTITKDGHNGHKTLAPTNTNYINGNMVERGGDKIKKRFKFKDTMQSNLASSKDPFVGLGFSKDEYLKKLMQSQSV